MPEVAGRDHCWLRSPWGAGRPGCRRAGDAAGTMAGALGQSELSHQRHHLCFTESLMLGKKCESSSVLPFSPGRRCPHPGMCYTPKKLFSSWPRMATSQVRQLSRCLHHQTHTALWYSCFCAGVCAGTATRTSCRGARGPAISLGLQTHIQGVHLSHPTGASAPRQDLADICWSSACARGARHRCSVGCSLPATLMCAGVTSGAAGHHPGPACSAVEPQPRGFALHPPPFMVCCPLPIITLAPEGFPMGPVSALPHTMAPRAGR